jgi:putative transposase
LFSHIQKHAGEKGIQILGMNGVEDHVHCLFQLLPTQNLVQVMKTVKALCADWINTTQLLKAPFEWEEWFAAYTVSPSGIKPILDFIAKQEEHHATRTLDNELEVFDIMEADIKQYS